MPGDDHGEWRTKLRKMEASDAVAAAMREFRWRTGLRRPAFVKSVWSSGHGPAGPGQRRRAGVPKEGPLG
jgi:hypothetical protein